MPNPGQGNTNPWPIIIVALAVITMSLLSACAKTSTATLSEPAVIEQLTYVPGGTATGIGYAFGDARGNGGGPVVTSTSIPDRYGVVLHCKHGKFVLRPDGDNAERIFQQFKTGDSINVVYIETYEHTTVNGQDVRELVKMDFLSASLRRRP